MSLFLIPTFFLSEGFVAGVGPTGASYSAELSLDQSKVRVNQIQGENQQIMCFCSNLDGNVTVGGGQQPLPHGGKGERADSGFQKSESYQLCKKKTCMKCCCRWKVQRMEAAQW